MDPKKLKQLQEDVKSAVGKRIDAFCSSALAKDNSQNQCAHFVSHVLDYDFPPPAASCKNMNWDDKNNPDVTGATIRVDVRL